MFGSSKEEKLLAEEVGLLDKAIERQSRRVAKLEDDVLFLTIVSLALGVTLWIVIRGQS